MKIEKQSILKDGAEIILNKENGFKLLREHNNNLQINYL